MEIDLLQHSTYDVEKIKKNKEFFEALFNKLKQTYQLFRIEDASERNKREVCFAPKQNRVENVFLKLDINGELKISVRGDKKKLSVIGYKFREENLFGFLTIEGVTAENYQNHLPNIVKAIEACDYSFR